MEGLDVNDASREEANAVNPKQINRGKLDVEAQVTRDDLKVDDEDGDSDGLEYNEVQYSAKYDLLAGIQPGIDW